jgi:hypothetical protein
VAPTRLQQRSKITEIGKKKQKKQRESKSLSNTRSIRRLLKGYFLPRHCVTVKNGRWNRKLAPLNQGWRIGWETKTEPDQTVHRVGTEEAFRSPKIDWPFPVAIIIMIKPNRRHRFFLRTSSAARRWSWNQVTSNQTSRFWLTQVLTEAI